MTNPPSPIITDEAKAAYLTGAIAVGLAHGYPLERVKEAALQGHKRAEADVATRNERVATLTELCHSVGKR